MIYSSFKTGGLPVKSPMNIPQGSLIQSFPHQVIISETQSTYTNPQKQKSGKKKQQEQQSINLENMKKLMELNETLTNTVEKMQLEIKKKNSGIEQLQEELNLLKEQNEGSVFEQKMREMVQTNQKLLVALEENELESKQNNQKLGCNDRKIQEQAFAIQRLQIEIKGIKENEESKQQTIEKMTEYNKQIANKNQLLVEENKGLMEIIENNRMKDKTKDEEERQRKREIERAKEGFQNIVDGLQQKQEQKQRDIERKLEELEMKKKQFQQLLNEEQKRAEKQALMNRQLSEKMQNSIEQNLNLEQEIQLYNEQGHQLQLVVEERKNEITQLNDQIVDLKKQLNEQKDVNKEMIEIKKSLEGNKEYLEKELVKKEDEIKKVNEQLSVQSKQANQFLDTVNKQENEISQLLKKGSRLQEIISELENEKKQVVLEGNENLKSQSQQLKEQIFKNESMEQQLQKIHQLNETLQKKFIDQDTNIKHIEIENQKKTSELIDASSRINFLEQENLQLDDEISRLYQAVTGKDCYINELKNQIIQLNQAIETQLLELKIKENKVEKSHRDIEFDRESNEQRRQNLQNELNNIQCKLQDEQNENLKLKAKLNLQNKQIEEFEVSLMKTSNYNQIMTENQRQKMQVTDQESKQNQLQDEILQLKQQLQDSEQQQKKEKLDLQNSHNEFIESLENSQKYIEKTYKNRINELEFQLNQIKSTSVNHAKMKLLESKCQNLLLSQSKLDSGNSQYQLQQQQQSKFMNKTTSNLSTPGKFRLQNLMGNSQFKGEEAQSYNLKKYQL